MHSEVNESFSPSSFRGRISLHMLSSLAKDIFPNFSYNVSILVCVCGLSASLVA